LQIVEQIIWDKTPLIPAITQDFKTKEVLMLAYMNKEALKLSLSTNIAHYYSRSREKLWKKGESSGHIQNIKSIKLDCDKDSILLEVEQIGVACHSGAKSCFFNEIKNNKIIDTKIKIKDMNDIYSPIDILYHTILDKKSASPNVSYTAQLFSKGENTILKKIVEESGEFCFAIKDNNKDEIIYEAADLLYHSLVALAYKDISPELIKNEIKKRFNISGLEEKNNRKK
jgi:phosphoribosyl-ATP pyrophosphohydrolase/phosphoribosyl-AMP cyclohydrolase